MNTKNKTLLLSAALILTSIIPAFGMGHLKRLGTYLGSASRYNSLKMTKPTGSHTNFKLHTSQVARSASNIPKAIKPSTRASWFKKSFAIVGGGFASTIFMLNQKALCEPESLPSNSKKQTPKLGDYIKLPSENLLEERLKKLALDDHLTKKILQKLAGKEKPLIAVVTVVNLALENYCAYLQDPELNDKAVSACVTAHLLKPLIIEAIFEDHPDAINELKKHGLLPKNLKDENDSSTHKHEHDGPYIHDDFDEYEK